MTKDISVRIIEVTIVPGNSLNSGWRSDMQKIVTELPAESKEKFYIDNMPGFSFGKQDTPGFNWETKVGQFVNAKTTVSKGFSWLQFSSVSQPPPDNLVTTSALAKQHGLKTVELIDRLVDAGYLLTLSKENNKYIARKEAITDKGKEAGCEFRTNQHGPFFMWPSNLEIQAQS